MNAGDTIQKCIFCGNSEYALVFTYDAPPAGEVRFEFNSRGPYLRKIWRCSGCGHFISIHNMDEGALYSGEYVNSTYGDDGIRRAFERIINLDPSRSDNVGRVRRINEFMARHLNRDVSAKKLTVLDVGSGLCVFLHRMKATGWDGTALDPDARAVRHAREVVGVNAIQDDFMRATLAERYDLVTFNKVLEHVKDPVAMLAKSASLLIEGGYVYVEVPDGEEAVIEGPGREEFFIDHHHIFSLASLSLLAAAANLRIKRIERLQEPSTKYTLTAFLRPASAGLQPTIHGIEEQNDERSQ